MDNANSPKSEYIVVLQAAGTIEPRDYRAQPGTEEQKVGWVEYTDPWDESVDTETPADRRVSQTDLGENFASRLIYSK